MTKSVHWVRFIRVSNEIVIALNLVNTVALHALLMKNTHWFKTHGHSSCHGNHCILMITTLNSLLRVEGWHYWHCFLCQLYTLLCPHCPIAVNAAQLGCCRQRPPTAQPPYPTICCRQHTLTSIYKRVCTPAYDRKCCGNHKPTC